LRKTLLVVVAVLAAAPVHAEQWYYLAADDSSVVFADAESVQDFSGYWNVEVIQGQRRAQSEPARVVRLSVEINCGLKQYRIGQAATFDDDGHLNEANAVTDDWKQFEGAGLPEEVGQFACDGGFFDQHVPSPFWEARDYWRD